jgi:hypothetical protein
VTTTGHSKNKSDVDLSSNGHENTYLMDMSKPEGDACREDGTLKDASEMEWPDSPTEYNQALINQHEEDWRSRRFNNNGSELEWPASDSPVEDSHGELGEKRKRKDPASNRSESEETEPDEAPKAKVRSLL